MKWRSISLLILASLVFMGCTSPQGQNDTNMPMPLLAGDDIATPEMLEELQSSYGFVDLDGFSLYHEVPRIQCEFKFHSGVTNGQLESAHDFGYEKLHLAKINQIGQLEFDLWLADQEYLFEGIQETCIRIFIDETLIYQYDYKDDTLLNTFENYIYH